MNGRLLDTTVLVDLFRGSEEAADFVNAAFGSHAPVFVSVISAMELVAGCRDQAEVAKAQKLLAEFSLIHLSPVECARAYELMIVYSKSHGLSIPDALIAATAITQDLELATDNERHFRMIPGLIAKQPY